MQALKNNIKFDNLKGYLPNLVSSSKDKVSGAISSFLENEADSLMKSEQTDAELKTLLTSKMEIEVINGLKFIMAVYNTHILFSIFN